MSRVVVLRGSVVSMVLALTAVPRSSPPPNPDLGTGRLEENPLAYRERIVRGFNREVVT
jgi:hypothetical protein